MKIKIQKWGKEYFKPYRYKGLKGGRGGSKSYFFADLIVIHHVKDPSFQSVCVREILKSLKFSVKKLIEDRIRALGVSHLFDITMTEIRRKGGTGIIIFQGLQDHTADSIKSLEGFNCCWVEEAQSISERSLELLLPTIRSQDSEIWFSWNPRSPTDPVEVLFSHEGKDILVKHINFTDNYYCTDEIKKEAERHRITRPETYDHVWLGVANSGTENAFIKPEWINACIDAHKKIDLFNANDGDNVIGYDIADEEEHGSDSSATCRRKGSIVVEIKEWKDSRNISDSAKSVYRDAAANSCRVVFDGVGMGAGTRAVFKDINDNSSSEINITSFIAGGAVYKKNSPVSKIISDKNRDFFRDAKAQLWWQARQRIHNTYMYLRDGGDYTIDELVSIKSTELSGRLCSELSRPKIMYDNNDRVYVESKKELAKRSVKSPNLADAFVMMFYRKKGGIYIG